MHRSYAILMFHYDVCVVFKRNKSFISHNVLPFSPILSKLLRRFSRNLAYKQNKLIFDKILPRRNKESQSIRFQKLK